MRLTRFALLLPRLLALVPVVLAVAPSAQAMAWERSCIGIPAELDLCRYHVDVTVDPDSRSASLAFGVCGESEPTWKLSADPDTDGGTVWVPLSADQDNGPSRSESYGSHCDGEEQSPPPTGLHQRVYV